ncbi:hypothetical protein Scep_023830 [Stephania cephalantha]|uniref:Uncharacterized protein n=1 Tax=Stephania cephalantha TaxID=152367 RepID=A0AAP0EY67_9MAGN
MRPLAAHCCTATVRTSAPSAAPSPELSSAATSLSSSLSLCVYVVLKLGFCVATK